MKRTVCFKSIQKYTERVSVMHSQPKSIKVKKLKLPLHIFFVVLCLLFVYPVVLTIAVSRQIIHH